MTDKSLKTIKEHCNDCLRETNHFIVAIRQNSDSESIGPDDPYEQIEVYWTTTYTMLECCGCERVCLKREFYFSEWDGAKTEYYPPQISRPLPEWHEELPQEMRELLLEVYSALHADSRRLAIMGTRTLVDIYMNEKLGDIGGFAQKLKKLGSEGLISKPNAEHLDAALEAGHAAAHRGHRARSKEVNQVIDIVENLLQNYVLDLAAANLKAMTPLRSVK